MLSFKKNLMLACTILSSLSFAGTMGDKCIAEHVTIPCEMNGWDIGVEALYLQVTNNQGRAVVGNVLAQNTPIPEASGPRIVIVNNVNDFSPRFDWGFGFKVQGSKHFSTGKDFNVNWSSYRKTSSVWNDFSPLGVTPDPNGIIPNANGIVSIIIPITPTLTQLKPKWDAVNFELAQSVDLGQVSHARYYAGFQYARIQNPFIQFSPSVAITLFGQNLLGSHFASITNSYNGFGPRMGADLDYDVIPHVIPHLSVYGDIAAALLVGRNKINAFFQDIGRGTTPAILDQIVSVQQNFHHAFTSIVPELEAKVGVEYLTHVASGELTLNVGYMWTNYFEIRSTDFGLHGINFGAKWVG